MPTFRQLKTLDEKLAQYRRGEVDNVTRIFWNLSYKTILKEAIETSSRNNLVLDVGCGTGSYLIALSKTGRTCIGIDPLREVSLKAAKMQSNEEKATVFLCQGVGEFLPFKSEVFDTILCISTLQHVSNQSMTLHEIKRVLKSNGSVLLSVPTVRNINTWFKEVKIPNYFTRGFDIRSFKKVLVDGGFRILNMTGYGFFPPFIFKFLHIWHLLFGERPTFQFIELLNVFAPLWLSAASSLVALCRIEG